MRLPTRLPPTLAVIALMGCNQPPGGHVVSIQPAEPTTVDDLEVILDELAYDEDEDVLAYQYAWYRDGALLAELEDVTVPADRTTKGEVWTVEVTVNDGKLTSEAPATASVTIQNSAPTLELSLVSDRVGTEVDIEATVDTTDLDEDEVELDVSWTQDGTPVELDALTVPAALTSKGEIWEVTVIARDDESESAPQTLAARVTNTAPVALGATLTPSDIDASTRVRCVSQGWRDVDGDDPDYRVSWVINGTETTSPGEVLTGEFFDKGDAISCILVPWDGEDEGEPVTSDSVVVQNIAPSVLSASLDPTSPTTTDDVTVTLGEVEDLDGDRVDVEVRWTVDGRASGTGLTLPASRTAKGRQISATLIPTDGEDDGPAYKLGPITVANTPPQVSSVTITPSTARTNDTLRAVASATDVDADSVSLTYTWQVNGTPIPGSTSTLSGSRWFDKGDSITVTATPDDGTDTGTPVTSASLRVANTPPTAPSIRINPSSPSPSDTLRCQLTTASTDADGDSLSYSAAWTRNGSTYSGGSTSSFTRDTIPASATSSGETWVCQVTVTDGTDSAVSSTASVEVESWKGRRVFTTCSATGAAGPSSSRCTSAYTSTTLAGEVTVSSGKQLWTVPTTGTYRIEAYGAQGASAQSGQVGGKGARIRGDFYLTKGTRLTLVVGQEGTDDGCSGGGGGGSYVARGSTTLLVAAGGGGTRTSVSQDGCDGKTSQQAGTGSSSSSTWGCGAKATSSIGAGGIVSSSSWGSGGGAWSNDGAYEYTADNRGRSFTNGSRGGGNTTYDAYGGFGGGGSGNGSCGGGGGGGYSGGDGGRLAGGGGSYNSGSSQSSSSGARSGHGQITIDLL